MKSNDALRNLAGNWDLVREAEVPEDLQIYQVNPWVVDIEGKTDNAGTYDPAISEVEFTVNDIYYLGTHTTTLQQGKIVRILSGTCNDGSGEKNWTATFKD